MSSKAYRRRNRVKIRAHKKKYREAHKEMIAAHKRKVRGATKQFIVDYKKKHPCELCGEADLACLHFHHIDPKQKEFGVRGAEISFKKLMNEINKCKVLCANCHAKVHYYNLN